MTIDTESVNFSNAAGRDTEHTVAPQPRIPIAPGGFDAIPDDQHDDFEVDLARAAGPEEVARLRNSLNTPFPLTILREKGMKKVDDASDGVGDDILAAFSPTDEGKKKRGGGWILRMPNKQYDPVTCKSMPTDKGVTKGSARRPVYSNLIDCAFRLNDISHQDVVVPSVLGKKYKTLVTQKKWESSVGTKQGKELAWRRTSFFGHPEINGRSLKVIPYDIDEVFEGHTERRFAVEVLRRNFSEMEDALLVGRLSSSAGSMRLSDGVRPKEYGEHLMALTDADEETLALFLKLFKAMVEAAKKGDPNVDPALQIFDTSLYVEDKGNGGLTARSHLLYEKPYVNEGWVFDPEIKVYPAMDGGDGVAKLTQFQKKVERRRNAHAPFRAGAEVDNDAFGPWSSILTAPRFSKGSGKDIYLDHYESDSQGNPRKIHANEAYPTAISYEESHPMHGPRTKAAWIAYLEGITIGEVFERYGQTITDADRQEAKEIHAINKARGKNLQEALMRLGLSRHDYDRSLQLSGYVMMRSGLMPDQAEEMQQFIEKHSVITWEGPESEKTAFNWYNTYWDSCYANVAKPVDWNETQLGSVEEALSYANEMHDIFLRAATGAGKSELIKKIMAVPMRTLLVAPLIALIRDLADKWNVTTYQSIEQSREELLTTLHSLVSKQVKEWVGKKNVQRVIIDEVSTVAAFLSTNNETINDDIKRLVLKELLHLKEMGAQFIMLDAHTTEDAALLAKELGVDTKLWAPSAYEAPQAKLYFVENPGKGKETDPLRDRLLPPEGNAAIACDTKGLSKLWGDRLEGRPGLLVVNGDTVAGEEQQRFLDDPNGVAKEYEEKYGQFVLVYNSTLGAGVSITSVEMFVALVTSGHLSPHSTIQTVRRVRRAKGGVIHIQVMPEAGHAKTWGKAGEDITPEKRLESLEYEDFIMGRTDTAASLLNGLKCSRAEFDRRWSSCPIQALWQLLEEDGFNPATIELEDLRADDSRKAENAARKKAKRLAVAAAEDITDSRAANLTRKGKGVGLLESEKDALRKHRIKALLLPTEDELKAVTLDGGATQYDLSEEQVKHYEAVSASTRKAMAILRDDAVVNRPSKEERRDRMIRHYCDFFGMTPKSPKGKKPASTENLQQVFGEMLDIMGRKASEAWVTDGVIPKQMPKGGADGRTLRRANAWFSEWVGVEVVQGKGSAPSTVKLSRPVAQILARHEERLEAEKAGRMSIDIREGEKRPKPPNHAGYSGEFVGHDPIYKSAFRVQQNQTPETCPEDLTDTGSEEDLSREEKEALREIRQDRIGAIPTTPRSEWTAQQRIDTLIVMSGFAQPGGVRFEGLELSANDGEYAA